MTASSYAVWVLSLQAAAYLGYLDFGLQTAVGRYISFATEKNDIEGRNAIFSSAFAGLSIACVIGLVAVFIISGISARIFPSIPPDLVPALHKTILIVGISVAVGLPASAWTGLFIGLQRYELSAVAIGLPKILAAAGLVIAAFEHCSLVCMACILAISNCLSYLIQFCIKRRVAWNIRFDPKLITLPVIRELSSYCLSLTVWSLCMLLVNGFDLMLVGHFQFSQVTAYSVSSTLILFLTGVQNAVFGVIMPHAAALQARSDSKTLGFLLVRATRLGCLLLLTTGLPLLVYSYTLLHIWIGTLSSALAGSILMILVLANLVRLIGVPYATILVGTGQQKLILIGPVLEGLSNLAASLVLGHFYGALGIAWGTLIGAVIGMLANILYNIPRTRPAIDVSVWHYLKNGILAPSLYALPVAALLAFRATGSTPGSMAWGIAFAVFAIGATLSISPASLNIRNILR